MLELTKYTGGVSDRFANLWLDPLAPYVVQLSNRSREPEFTWSDFVRPRGGTYRRSRRRWTPQVARRRAANYAARKARKATRRQS